MRIIKPNMIPFFYIPNTIYLIDDDVLFTNSFSLGLQDEFILKIENDPNIALEFLNNQYQQNPFWLNCFEIVSDVYPKKIKLDVKNLYKAIYTPDRYEQLNVVISDYAMPGLTGLELLKKAKTEDSYINPSIKTIILTGEIESPAEFLEEINAFYTKNQPLEELVQKIHACQKLYFEEASLSFLHALTNESNRNTFSLIDPKIIELIQKYLKEEKIVEYYLIDKQGSLFLLDKKANLFWFLICNEEETEKNIEFAKESNAPKDVIHQLQQRNKLLFIPTNVELQSDLIVWNDYLHSCHMIEGQDRYYYAFTTDLKHHGIERNKILSLENYLESVSLP